MTVANHIMRASHCLTLSEKRLIAIGLEKSDATEGRAIADERFWTVEILALDYSHTFAVTLETAYGQLQVATDGLLSKLIKQHGNDRRDATRINKHAWLLQRFTRRKTAQ